MQTGIEISFFIQFQNLPPKYIFFSFYISFASISTRIVCKPYFRTYVLICPFANSTKKHPAFQQSASSKKCMGWDRPHGQSRRPGSNRRPPGYEPGELPSAPHRNAAFHVNYPAAPCASCLRTSGMPAASSGVLQSPDRPLSAAAKVFHGIGLLQNCL